MNTEMVGYRYIAGGSRTVLAGAMPLVEALEVIANEGDTDAEDTTIAGFPVRAGKRYFPASLADAIPKKGKGRKPKADASPDAEDKEPLDISEDTEEA